MNIAYSPCPNDTFIFDAWVHGKITSKLKPEPVLADIQQLNAWTYSGRFSLSKISAFCLGRVTDRYIMLPSGAAFGKMGPKLIAKEYFSPEEIKNKRVLIPGLDTTAYLLLRTLLPEAKEIGVCRYDEIVPKLLQGEADAGVIIHETHFTFARSGLQEIADLGKLFYANFGCLVPLGVVVAKKDVYQEACRSLKASIQYAIDNPLSSQKYVMQCAQEKDPDIIAEHIKAFVTDETFHIGQEGIKAIKTLFTLAIDQKLLPTSCLTFYETNHLCHF